ncbi:MAG: hypothetical protein KBA30_04665 [Clostridia bacterium]|nr:hypothetical protein [Clostridia bacterium]
MLRCTIAGLTVLMASERYGGMADAFFSTYSEEFAAVVRLESYYLIRRFPPPIAAHLLDPVLPGILSRQRPDGLWRKSARITYDILSAMRRAGDPDPASRLNHPLPEAIPGATEPYPVLIKKDILGRFDERDRAAAAELASAITAEQRKDGSWEGTVTATSIRLETLLDLGEDADGAAVRRGLAFLYGQWKEELPGIHTREPYGLVGRAMFTGADRNAEFLSAQQLRPEWIPRQVCFRTLAVLPNAVCLLLLLRLGQEGDDRVVCALENLHALLTEYGGLCATQIKKPFL